MSLVTRTCSECSGVGTRADAAGGVFYPLFCRTCEGSGEVQVVMPDPLDESDLGYRDELDVLYENRLLDAEYSISAEEFRAFSDEEYRERVEGILSKDRQKERKG